MERFRLPDGLAICRKFGAKTVAMLLATIFLTAECSMTRARKRKRQWRVMRFGCGWVEDLHLWQRSASLVMASNVSLMAHEISKSGSFRR